ncbi:MAG: 4'-phosphopantetheinyl transferase superfamily protein [Planctomycetes bacterium]|nr:4'-phosphopantetheinyl transferase superfamily protein [Planctomycetota bacterium]
MILVPVTVIPYVTRAAPLRGRERVLEQSARAREALALAARSVGAELGELEKDEEDAPLPSNGWHWSVSHAEHYAAATLARFRIGIDVEEVRPRSQTLVPRVTSRVELELLGGFDWQRFFRVWTAKEAVLKRAGQGLLELSGCKLVAVPDTETLILNHRGRDHVVRQFMRANHIVSVSHDGPAAVQIEWSFEPAAHDVAEDRA